MSDLVNMVFDFNEHVIKLPVIIPLGSVNHDGKQWIITALREEITEFERSYDADDFIGQVDSMLDLVYFAIGQLKRMGLTRDQAVQCFTAVHTANMTKKRGVKGTRGDFEADAVKPEHWRSPEDRLAAILWGVR